MFIYHAMLGRCGYLVCIWASCHFSFCDED